jgi:hypothetical protein
VTRGIARVEIGAAKPKAVAELSGQLRKAYPALRFVGTNRWQSPDGLFLVDDAKPIAKPRLRHIIEIKLGTCGDF